jgi:hypothetical protein
MPEENKPSGGYGKRPLWQWLLVYLIVGGAIYFLIYYFFLRDSGTTSLY